MNGKVKVKPNTLTARNWQELTTSWNRQSRSWNIINRRCKTCLIFKQNHRFFQMNHEIPNQIFIAQTKSRKVFKSSLNWRVILFFVHDGFSHRTVSVSKQLIIYHWDYLCWVAAIAGCGTTEVWFTTHNTAALAHCIHEARSTRSVNTSCLQCSSSSTHINMKQLTVLLNWLKHHWDEAINNQPSQSVTHTHVNY